MTSSDPVSTFANNINQVLLAYNSTSLTSETINRLFKEFPHTSPTMFATAIYLCNKYNITNEEQLKDGLTKAFNDEKVMKDIYAQHLKKKKDTDYQRRLIKMDVIRYTLMYLGISIIPEPDVEEEGKNEEKESD